MGYEIIKGKICNTGNKSDIPLLTDVDNQGGISYDKGYGAITSEDKLSGGIPPDRMTLNQFFYITSSNLFAFQNGELPTFNANALQYMTGNGYPLNAILWCEAEERLLKSAVANNNYNFITTPSYIGSYWVFLNDDEVSDITTGLTLTNTSTGITVSTGFVKSATSGRILKLTSSLNNLWSNIQSNSSLTPSANSKYNLYLAYNPSTTTYVILASSYTAFVPSLPSDYTDYALLGYMSTDNNVAVNNVYPNQDLNDWYLLGGANRDRHTRFCANSGNLDSNGNADLMSVSGSVITWKIDDGTNYKPLVCTPANELISFTLTSVNNFNVSTLSDGNYTLCINRYGVVSAMGAINIQNSTPTSPSVNDIWVNTAIEPLNAYCYTGSWVAFNNVPIATISVAGGSIIDYKSLPFNFTIKTIIPNYSMPDYSAGVSKTRGIKYTAECDGIVVFCIDDEHNATMELLINDSRVFYSGARDNDGRSVDGTFRVQKGDTYKIQGGSNTWYFQFYPLKGAIK